MKSKGLSMHLSDQQLQDIDTGKVDLSEMMVDDLARETKFNQTQSMEAHLSECALCQKRLTLVSQFRQKLSSDTQCTLPEFNWAEVEIEIENELAAPTMVGNSRSDITLLRKKLKQAHVALVAIAASILVLLFYPNMSDISREESELQLRELILENYALQQEFSGVRQARVTQIILHKSTQISLQEIDQKIQLSYLDDVAIEEKINLWNERKHLLIKSLENNSQPSLITI
jgi:hypothetical protein